MKPMDVRFFSNCIQKSAFKYDFVELLCDEMLKIFESTKECLVKSDTEGIMTRKPGPIH